MKKIMVKNKLSIKDYVIIAGLFVILALILFDPISTGVRTSMPSGKADIHDSSERITNKYQRCVERADSSLGGYDRMEGTSLSKENLAAQDREQCKRTYNLEMRVLKME